MLAKPMPSQSDLLSLFEFDPETGKLYRSANGKLAGWTDANGYRIAKINNSAFFVHRIVWAMHHGQISPEMMIDHINGEPGDNRLENLRLVTNQQNQYNKRADKGRKYKGVYRSRTRWKAEISTAAGRLFLGVFQTPEEAAAAYNAAATEHHGEHAWLNEIPAALEPKSTHQNATPIKSTAYNHPTVNNHSTIKHTQGEL